MEDLSELLLVLKKLLNLTCTDDGTKRICALDELSGFLLASHRKTKRLEDLEESLKLGQTAYAELLSLKRKEESVEYDLLEEAILQNTSSKYHLLCEISDSLELLEDALRHERLLVEGHCSGKLQNRASRYYQLGQFLVKAYHRTHGLQKVEESVQAYNSATQHIQKDYPDALKLSLDLAKSYDIMYSHTGKQVHTERAQKLRDEVRLKSAGVNRKWKEQADSLQKEMNIWTLYQDTDAITDLNHGIKGLQEKMNTIDKTNPHRETLLTNLVTLLLQRYEAEQAMVDIDEARKLLEDCDLRSHQSNTYRLSILGICNCYTFKRDKTAESIQNAIRYGQEAVKLAKLGENADLRIICANNMGKIMVMRFEDSGRLEDLEEALTYFEDVLEGSTNNDSSKYLGLGNLAAACTLKFYKTSDLKDLQDAIAWGEETVEAVPSSKPEKAVALTNLGCMLLLRYEAVLSPGDLDIAIAALEQAVFHTLNSKHRYQQPAALAIALQIRSQTRKQPADLDRAIKLLEQTLEHISEDNHAAPILLKQLHKAQALKSRNPAIPDMFRMMVEAFTGLPLDDAKVPPQILKMLPQHEEEFWPFSTPERSRKSEVTRL